jgi:hypothetical protein
MPRSQLPRNVRPALSHDAADKLRAVLNLNSGESAADFRAHPGYAEACRAWRKSLTDDQLDWALHTVDATLKWGDEYGKRWAAHLPPAPRCPL